MSIAYQCWEMGVGSPVGYKLSQGPSHGPQCVSENGPTFRYHHSSPSHEPSFSSFAMYMQHPAKDDLKSFSHPKDPATPPKETIVRFAASPQASSPVSAAASSPALDVARETAAPSPPTSTNVTTSSVTTERSLLEKATASAMEAQSKRLEAEEEAASAPRTIVPCRSVAELPCSPGVPSFPGSRLLDSPGGLRVKLLSKSKPGVVEPVVALHGGSPFGGFMYGSGNVSNMTHLAEHSSESSSSICQASEDSGSCSSGDTGGEEAQSAYRGPLTTMMSALDESLPIKRPGLSKFFGGKSRSFSSLAEVSSVTELAKPNNPYAKRRKMGFNCPLGDKTRSYPPPSRSSGASIAKKLPSHGSRNALAVAVMLGGLQEEQNHELLQHHQQQLQEPQQLGGAGAPPAPGSFLGVSQMRTFPSQMRTFPSRSYSLTDLPHAGSPPPLRRAFVRP